MARVIAFTNHKGGVGKTTTAVNLAFALTMKRKKVLLVDADPQGNASSTLGEISPFEQQCTVRDLLVEKDSNFTSCAVATKYKNLDLIASNINAATVSVELSQSDPKRFIGFKTKFDEAADKHYDYVFIDCPPAIDGPFLVNALILSDYYLIPIEAESVYALSGVDSLLKAVETLTEGVNESLSLLGALITMYDARNSAAKFMTETILDYFGEDTVFTTRISRNTSVNKANMLSRAVCDFEPKAQGCQDYRNLANELEKRIKARES